MRQVLSRRLPATKMETPAFPSCRIYSSSTAAASTRQWLRRSSVPSILICRYTAWSKMTRHRTRALITAQGQEVGIAATPAVFAFVGTIQEETHRFAIAYHKTLRSRRLRKSELDDIPGVGQKRKELLLKRFHSIKAIREASLEELSHLPPPAGSRRRLPPLSRQQGGLVMRVITGSARGIRLKTPDGHHTRPTTERQKRRCSARSSLRSRAAVSWTFSPAAASWGSRPSAAAPAARYL